MTARTSTNERRRRCPRGPPSSQVRTCTTSSSSSRSSSLGRAWDLRVRAWPWPGFFLDVCSIFIFIFIFFFSMCLDFFRFFVIFLLQVVHRPPPGALSTEIMRKNLQVLSTETLIVLWNLTTQEHIIPFGGSGGAVGARRVRRAMIERTTRAAVERTRPRRASRRRAHHASLPRPRHASRRRAHGRAHHASRSRRRHHHRPATVNGARSK